MAVYTHLSHPQIESLLAVYDIGRLVSAEGVAQGVENTNYFLTTDRGRYVLTLFERRTRKEDLPFFLGFMAHLCARGVTAPAPIADRSGAVLNEVAARPAVIVSFLRGTQRMAPTPADCRATGALLARMHLAAQDFAQLRANALGPEGWVDLAARCAPQADRCAPGLSELIVEESSDLSRIWPAALPRGAVHADLFPDNVFFDNDAISGVIDFYFACTDYFAYDLAITVNSWSSVNGAWAGENARAMFEGYESVRALSRNERDSMRTLLRGAALRFLLTRLFDWLNRVDGAVVAVKNPLEYRDLLVRHRASAPASDLGLS